MPTSFSEALAWVAAWCALELEEMPYLAKHLVPMPDAAMASAVERYVVTWHAAAEGGPGHRGGAGAVPV